MTTRHYSLIPEEQKQATHLKIGNLLLQNTPIEQVDENIFDIVNQLNWSIDSRSEPSEKVKLAQLNLIAGRLYSYTPLQMVVLARNLRKS